MFNDLVDDCLMAIYICFMYLLVLLAMDTFGRRMDRKIICRKVAKRSMYALLISLYQKRIYTIHVFHLFSFPLPGCIISLLPTALAGYMQVFCFVDAPQHQFVTDWISPFERPLDAVATQAN
ncbi:hypothetical protein KY285_037384 [Solanum tuberosum]|nr:hypothetical protein KY289_037581 [Solanum tuberosum]KAH0640798.1 hypothetical protein KY285_037384 [Solanum tuberosum]